MRASTAVAGPRTGVTGMAAGAISSRVLFGIQSPFTHVIPGTVPGQLVLLVVPALLSITQLPLTHVMPGTKPGQPPVDDGEEVPDGMYSPFTQVMPGISPPRQPLAAALPPLVVLVLITQLPLTHVIPS